MGLMQGRSNAATVIPNVSVCEAFIGQGNRTHPLPAWYSTEHARLQMCKCNILTISESTTQEHRDHKSKGYITLKTPSDNCT